MRKSISFDIDAKITEKILGDDTKIYKHIGRPCLLQWKRICEKSKRNDRNECSVRTKARK